MNKYPYPVLTAEGSSYKENVSFVLEYIDNQCVQDSVIFDFSLKLNSTTLSKLIDSDKAKIVLKTQTSIFSDLIEIPKNTDSIRHSIKLDKLMANDTIKFIAYILSTCNQDLSYSNEMIDIFADSYSIGIKKNDKLAESNTEVLSYNTTDNNFIKFSVSNDVAGKGYMVRFADNFINVIIGPEFNKAYGILKGSMKNVCGIFNVHLVFEVFVYLLVELVQRFEDYYENEWYKLFEQMFLQTTDYKSFEDFIMDAKDGDVLSMEVIFEMSHILTNNQIESTIVALSRIED